MLITCELPLPISISSELFGRLTRIFSAADQGLPPGSSDFCNCGGTTAPLLTATVSGTTTKNCAYTIQPTSQYDPKPPPSSTPPPPTPPPPYATGRCNVHVWEGLGTEIGQLSVYMEANITDASGAAIGTQHGGLDWGKTLNVDSKLPLVLLVTPETGLKKHKRGASDDGRDILGKRIGAPAPTRPIFEHGPVKFAYGAQSWDTGSSACSVGDFDNGNAGNFFGSLIFGDTFIPVGPPPQNPPPPLSTQSIHFFFEIH